MSEVQPKANHRRLWALTLMGLMLLATASVVAYEKAQEAPAVPFQIPAMDVTLTVKAYHNQGAEPFATRVVTSDLVLDNFNNALDTVLTQGTSNPITLTNFNFNTNGCGGAPSYCGIYLKIGTSGTAPSRSDTALGSAYTPSGGNANFADNSQNPTPCSVCNPAVFTHGTTNTISGISGSQPITGSATIQEAGLFQTNAASSFLLFRDTFTGISVSNGDTVTLSYSISLANSGFNDNFGQLIAAWMTGDISTGGSVSAFTLTQVGGATATFKLWCNGATGAIMTSACGSTSSVGKMALGTSNTAFTTSSIALTSMVGAYTTLSTNLYVSPTTYMTATQTITGSNTIQEAGYFQTLSGNNYMFFATTFTGQAQTTGVPFGFTLRWGD